jgi:hypothetical protein
LKTNLLNHLEVIESAQKLGLGGLLKMIGWWENKIYEIQFLLSITTSDIRNSRDSVNLGLTEEIDEEDILWSLFHFSPNLK